MNTSIERALTKVPELTLLFWIIKIAATTLGETAGDAVSMSMNLGYLLGTAIFAAVFVVAVIAQIRARGFHPLLYWTTIIATTTVGTTLADFADRSLGIGYAGGSTMLFAMLLASLAIWHRSLGSVSVGTISSPKAEMFYWLTIMFSQTLGTALGDWTAATAGLGYSGGAIVFAALRFAERENSRFTKVRRVVRNCSLDSKSSDGRRSNIPFEPRGSTSVPLGNAASAVPPFKNAAAVLAKPAVPAITERRRKE